MTQEIIKVKTGKGAEPRKGTDYTKFRENYDLIFKKGSNYDSLEKPK